MTGMTGTPLPQQEQHKQPDKGDRLEELRDQMKETDRRYEEALKDAERAERRLRKAGTR
jgi:hypothetical protein